MMRVLAAVLALLAVVGAAPASSASGGEGLAPPQLRDLDWCLAPQEAPDAARALRCLGVDEPAAAPEAPRLSPAVAPSTCVPGVPWDDRCEAWATDPVTGLNTVLEASPDDAVFYTAGLTPPQPGSTDFGSSIQARSVSTGDLLWERTDSEDTSHSFPNAATLSADGRILYIFSAQIVAYGYPVTTLRLASYDTRDGSLLWFTDTAGPMRRDIPWDLALSPDGTRLFATGMSGNPVPRAHMDGLTMAVDAESGAILWTRRVDNGLGKAKADIANRVHVSPDGEVAAITGHTETADGFAIMAVGYDAASGATVWEQRLQLVAGLDAGVTEFGSGAASPDGNTVYVLGSAVTDTRDGWSVVVAAFDTRTGHLRWVAQPHRSPSDFPAVPRTMTATADRVYLAGWTPKYLGGDLVLTALDAAAGGTIWRQAMDGAMLGAMFDEAQVFNGELPTDIATSRDGSSILLTGFNKSTRPPAFCIGNEQFGGARCFAPPTQFVIAFGPDGDRRWAARFNTAGADVDEVFPQAVVVAGDHVVVTSVANHQGASLGTRSYVTTAYDLH